MIRRISIFALLIGAGIVLAMTGHGLLFRSFMLYDDEGYVLITLRNFAEQGGLYDRVYSQYGPFFYVAYDAFHRLFGFAWDNTSGRWFTLGHWLATAGLCAVLVARARGTWAAALFVLVDTFFYLTVMISEPAHPGSLITTLVALTACLGGESLRANRPVAFALVTALSGAALALVKINVGLFLLAAAALWLAQSTPTRWVQATRWTLLVIGAALPFGLMQDRLQDAWVMTYAILFSLSVTSCLLAISPTTRSLPFPVKVWGIFAAAATGLILVIAGCLLLRGSTPNGLLNGVLLDPLRHPGAYAVEFPWSPGALLVGATGLLLMAVADRWRSHAQVMRAIAFARLIGAGVFLSALMPWMQTKQTELGLSYGLALAGVFALPLRASPNANDRIRGWLALLFVFQALHAYPVAGSQVGWGTFLWIPLLVLGLADAVDYLVDSAPSKRRHWVSVVMTVCLVGLTARAANDLASVRRHFSSRHEPLRQRGAEEIRIGASIGTAIRTISTNIEAHADVLFTLPGLYSFNLWTARPTPTRRTATHWFSLLSESEQREIIARLEASPRAVFVMQHLVLRTLEEQGTRPNSLLLDYLMGSFQPVFRVDSYSLWVHRNRYVAPLGTGTLQTRPGSEPQPWRLVLTVPAVAASISSVELYVVAENRQSVLTLNDDNAQVSIERLALDGQSTHALAPAAWPLALPSVSRLQFDFSVRGAFPAEANLLAVLRGQDGNELGFARVLPPAAFGPQRPATTRR